MYILVTTTNSAITVEPLTCLGVPRHSTLRIPCAAIKLTRKSVVAFENKYCYNSHQQLYDNLAFSTFISCDVMKNMTITNQVNHHYSL